MLKNFKVVFKVFFFLACIRLLFLIIDYIQKGDTEKYLTINILFISISLAILIFLKCYDPVKYYREYQWFIVVVGAFFEILIGYLNHHNMSSWDLDESKDHPSMVLLTISMRFFVKYFLISIYKL